MHSREKEMRSILKHYVNRQSQGEIEFIAEQKKSGIKVCDRILHQRSYDGKDELIIETQLSSANDDSGSSGTRACTLIRSENSCDHSHSSMSQSDYFIKELRFSHVGKSKSLDDYQMNRIGTSHQTSLTTVVGNKKRQFETVYTAVVDHSDTSRQLVQQESFVRDAMKMPSSYHSLPGRIVNSVSHLSPEKGNRRKSSKMKSWRAIFPILKKSKKSHVDLSDIDDLARQRANESSEKKVHAAPLSGSMSLNRDMPFKSFKIGEPLQPMKKKKKMPNFIRSMLSPSNSLPRSGFWSHKSHCDNNNEATQVTKEYSTSANEPTGEPVTRIVAILSKSNDEEDFTFRTNAEGRTDVLPERSRAKSGGQNVSDFHFDMTISDTRTRRKSNPDKPCNCDRTRLDLIAKAINVVILKPKPNKEVQRELTRELDLFNKETFHFEDCRFNVQSFGRRKGSSESSRHSRLSLYQHCDHCGNVDDQLHPEISHHLLPLISKLENGDEINFNDDHLRFFLTTKCYKEFEEGMKQAIGVKCSVRNLAHLHYVTRKVVRHIGDPNREDNEQIQRVMHFSEKFCQDHYNGDIEAHGSVEEFLKKCIQYEID